MFKNYFTIAYRTLRQSKSYTVVNVAGLALGIMSAMVIFLIVKNELSYERFNKKADRTYRITLHSGDYNSSVSFAVAPAFRTDIAEAENVSQYFLQGDALIRVDDNLYNVDHYAYADEQFMKIFDFEWIQGDPLTGLNEPNAIVLTESLAKKLFGTTDVLGKVLRFDNRSDLHVTGVMKDVPTNTHFIFSFLVSWKTIEKDVQNRPFWAIEGGYVYVTLPDAANAGRIAEQMDPFIKKNWGEDIARETDLLLQPLREIHFDQRYLQQVSMPRSKESVFGLAAIAIFIIITVSINFVNLATVKAIKRMKEVGIRKALGAYRKQLILQVLVEITLLVSVSVIIALAGILACTPIMASLLNVKIDPDQLLGWEFIVTLLSIAISIIVLAGLYPAVIQSAYQPVSALKNSSASTGKLSLSGRALIIVQFSISQLLIIATIVAGTQMDFFVNQNLGFEKDAIVTFWSGEKNDVLYQQIKNLPGVEDVSRGSASPVHNINFQSFSCVECGMNGSDVVEIKEVDENYLSMFHIGLLSGEPFVKKAGKDSIYHVMVNETLIKKMGITDVQSALGKMVMVGKTPTIIQGVIKDFQSGSKHTKIGAVMLVYRNDRNNQFSVRLNARKILETLASIDKIWTSLNPGYLFNYEFLDEKIANMYKQEQQIYNTIRIFSGIAIVIGCLGLYSLVSWMAVQRTKEIGIRKVLGASVNGIVLLFYKEFIWLLLVAFVIAAPLGWYIMSQWLTEFAYHININPSIFIASILTTLTVATLTIAYQTVKAAMTNPATSLKAN